VANDSLEQGPKIIWPCTATWGVLIHKSPRATA
jgi:hypothetical protein